MGLDLIRPCLFKTIQERQNLQNKKLEDEKRIALDCCAHWIGDKCVHEIIPGCSIK